MEQETWGDKLAQVGTVIFVFVLFGGMLYNAATTDGRLTIEATLRQAHPHDIAYLAIQLRAQAPGQRLADSAGIAPWLPTLRDWEAVGNRGGKSGIVAYDRLADIEMGFAPAYVRACHLRQAQLLLHLDRTSRGVLLWRETSNVYYRAPALLARLDTLSWRLVARSLSERRYSPLLDSLGRVVPAN